MRPAQAHKALSVFFGALAALAGFGFLRMEWTGGTDLDLTGFFWLIANIGRLTVLLVFVFCAGTSFSYWLRAYRAGG